MNQPQVIMLTLASLLFQAQIGTTVQYSVPYYTFCMLLIAISDVAPLLPPFFFFNRVSGSNSGNVFLEMHASCILGCMHPGDASCQRKRNKTDVCTSEALDDF